MLPEITCDEIRCLSRDDLDSVEIASKALNAFVSTHLDVNPLHDEILDGITAADLEHELRRTFIRGSYFYCVVTNAVVDALLPHIDKFRNTIRHAPTRYASSEVITRAFTELFFCSEIHIDTLSVRDVDDYWAYNNEAAFVALPCIQSCDLLKVHNLDRTKTDFTPKLNTRLHSGGETRYLTLECSMTHMSLCSRSRGLFNNMENATSPASYELTLFFTNNIFIGKEKAVNENTNEELVRTFERYENGGCVSFIRRSL